MENTNNNNFQAPQADSLTKEASPQISSGQPPASTQPLPLQTKPNHTMKFVLPILIVFLLSITGVYIYTQIYRAKNSFSAVTPTDKPHPVSENTPNPQTTPIENNSSFSKTYTSQALGVTFTYAPEYAGYKTKVKEEGNKIYVGSESYLNQFIQVFTVENDTSVSEDMQQRFLSDYSSEDCLITNPTTCDGLKNVAGICPVNQNFLILNIKANVDYESLDNLDKLIEAVSKCPADYTLSNGASYFAYNTRVPTKYIFYSIGQEPAWPASSDPNGPDTNLTWMQTVDLIGN